MEHWRSMGMQPLRAVVLTALAVSTHAIRLTAYGVSSDPLAAANLTFDFIVAGGGTAGLAVASRLSEDLDMTVLVIEAGGDNRTNPFVANVTQFVNAIGSPLDWAWKTDLNRTTSACVSALLCGWY